MDTEYKKRLELFCHSVVAVSKQGFKADLKDEDVAIALIQNGIMGAYHGGMTRQETIQVFVDEIEITAGQLEWK